MLAEYLKKFVRNTSIKTKIILILVIFVILPIITIGYFGYINYSNIMKENAIIDSQSTARELSSILSERIERLNLFSIQLLYDGRIYDANNQIVSGSMNSFTENDFQHYLQSKLFSKYELSELLIRFSDSEKIFEANNTYSEHTSSFFNINEIYKAAKEGHGVPTWYVATKDGKVSGLYISKIIYSINDIKKEIGLLVLKVDEHYIFDVFDNLISRQKQDLRVLGAEGEEIFSYGSIIGTLDKQIQNFINPESDIGVREMATKGDTVYMLYDTVQPLKWKLLIGISKDELFKEVRYISRFTILFYIVIFSVCIILINYLYTGIIKPMNLLIKNMRSVQNGDIGVVIESKRNDEFGYLYKTFNKMSLNIKNLINTVYKKQIAMQDAEIRALQAQIDPHFLYNTLEAINWKAKINGVEEISDMVSALSSIIDANLNRKNEKYIPIFKEIEYINNYTFLIKKRFGEKIKFNLNVDKEAKDLLIPKLIVQPIVENAIKHGLEMKKGGGTIDINITKEERSLHIEVSDNGLGIESELLVKIKEELKEGSFIDNFEEALQSSKIGILNVHRRIRLLFGENFGLEIFSEQNVGTQVIVRLPLDMPKGGNQSV